MNGAIGQKVQLRLLDPDAGYAFPPPKGGWPVVEGRLVAAVPGLHGLIWYLLELEKSLPAGFDPLQALPEGCKKKSVRYLLLSPAAPLPTFETPPDFIGDTLVRREVVPVLVSVGAAPENLPFPITADHLEILPGLCAGNLELIDTV